MKRHYAAIGLFHMLVVCGAFSPAANPPSLTHASMDVGNIISIVIPENPDENINVDQLTGEFRQQLERIKKQSRASKVEHGLVTLKRVLPEMSREEKRKTLPLIRRVLHGRRVANQGTMRNWTRDAHVEQMRDGGQYVRSRSPGNSEERRIHRDYEEIGAREAATMGVEQISLDKEEYRGINAERAYSNRHQDFARRDESVREDRIQFPEEDQQSAKMSRSGQDWSPHWEDQYRGEDRPYQETSTVDCNYKLDRTVRQKDPVNEIIQNDRYVKPSRLPELAPSVSEENADCNKLNQRVVGRYSPVPQSESIDNSKRNVNDVRGYETADIPTYVNYPRDFDVNAALNPNCDNTKKNNNSVQYQKDLEKIRGDISPDKFPQRQEPTNFEPEDYRSLQKTVLGQDPRRQPDRSNVSGLENIVNERIDDYIGKKKRGQIYPEELKGLSGINPSIDRWNRPIYENRPALNSSNEPRDSSNVYELFSEKIVTPGLSYIQTDQGNFRRNLNNPPKSIGTRLEPNYEVEGLPLRMQRSLNDLNYKFNTSKLMVNQTEQSMRYAERINEKNIFEQLRRLFKAPKSSKISYDGSILDYSNESEGKRTKIRETFTEDSRSESTLSPSAAGPSDSTSHHIVGSTTDNIFKFHVPENI